MKLYGLTGNRFFIMHDQHYMHGKKLILVTDSNTLPHLMFLPHLVSLEDSHGKIINHEHH